MLVKKERKKKAKYEQGNGFFSTGYNYCNAN